MFGWLLAVGCEPMNPENARYANVPKYIFISPSAAAVLQQSLSLISVQQQEDYTYKHLSKA